MTSDYAFVPAPQLNERLAAVMTRSAGTMRLTVVRNRHALLLSVAGEIDAANADAWARALSEVADAADASSLLLIDARELDFMGSVAFAAMAEQSDACSRCGIDMRLISTNPLFARVVDVCGWHAEIPVCPSVADALEMSRSDRRELVSGGGVGD